MAHSRCAINGNLFLNRMTEPLTSGEPTALSRLVVLPSSTCGTLKESFHLCGPLIIHLEGEAVRFRGHLYIFKGLFELQFCRFRLGEGRDAAELAWVWSE